MLNSLELRRQTLHLLYGPILVTLYAFHLLTLPILFGMILGGFLMSFMVKRKKFSAIRWMLSHFERDHHMDTFPGRGILFFTIGAFLTLALFPKPVAYAGILILSVGDALTNVVGRHFGRIRTRLNPNKYMEGTLVGILASIPIAYYFVPNLYAALSASCIAMFLELPNVRIFGFEIDDNLLIPLGACVTLSLFN
jgi:dolichol kinase